MHDSSSELEGSRSSGSRHSRRHNMKNSKEVRKSHDSLVLKLELPTFKGGKKADPDVHIQVFENWADMRGISKADYVSSLFTEGGGTTVVLQLPTFHAIRVSKHIEGFPLEVQRGQYG